jgi:hypothetical protein
MDWPSQAPSALKFATAKLSIHDVVTAVDIERFARNQTSRIMSEKGGRGTDIIDADQTLGRRLHPRRVK